MADFQSFVALITSDDRESFASVIVGTYLLWFKAGGSETQEVVRIMCVDTHRWRRFLLEHVQFDGVSEEKRQAQVVLASKCCSCMRAMYNT